MEPLLEVMMLDRNSLGDDRQSHEGADQKKTATSRVAQDRKQAVQDFRTLCPARVAVNPDAMSAELTEAEFGMLSHAVIKIARRGEQRDQPSVAINYSS